jgi:hypothetical protein
LKVSYGTRHRLIDRNAPKDTHGVPQHKKGKGYMERMWHSKPTCEKNHSDPSARQQVTYDLGASRLQNTYEHHIFPGDRKD